MEAHLACPPGRGIIREQEAVANSRLQELAEGLKIRHDHKELSN